MKKGKKLYEGKAKIIYATSDKNLVVQYFKDDATAFNNQKKAVMDGKGILNNRISEHILTQLNNVGIKNYVEDYGAGLVISEKKPQLIAPKISRLLDDYNLRSKMGSKGKYLCENELSWDKIAEHTENYYKFILSEFDK